MSDFNGVVELTQKLISFQSVNPPGDVREITDYIEEQCSQWHLAPERLSGKAQKPCLRMQVGTGEGPTLVCYGHTDVVGVTDLERDLWKTDPFEGTIVGERLYGRGSVDSKGTLASMLVAARELKKRESELKGTVVFWVVSDGEVGDQDGLKWLDEQGYLSGDMVIACEPSEMRIIRAFKGRAWFDLYVRGRTRHSLTPNSNDNAIKAAFKVLQGLEEGFQTVPQGVSETGPEILGSASFTVTQIHAGKGYNVSPGECHINLDIRMMPGDSSEATLERLNAAVKNLDLDGWSVEFEVVPGSLREPVILPDEANIVGVMQKAMSASGLKPEFGRGFSSGGVGNFLAKNIPGVFYGPGTIQDAHGADESVALSDLRKTAEVYYQAGLAAAKA